MASAIAQRLAGAVSRTHDRGAVTVEAVSNVDTARAGERRDKMRRHGVTGQFSMMIRGAVALAVGVFIVSAIFGAIPDSNSLSGAQTQVEDLTGQAFEIAPVVLIVLVAVLILQFVRDL
jgi:Na+/melibiose symporter-like transporter